MGLESNLTESRVDSESKKRLDFNFDNLDSNTESKQLTESTTPKNPSEALLNTNNSACASTMPKRNCKIAPFLQRKNQIKCVGAIAPTDTRPLRGVQSLRKGGSSASATIALEAEKARLSRQKIYFVAAEKTQRVASKAQQKSGALSFSGLGRAGRGETPFLFAQTRDSKNLESIRENAILRNLESTESSADSESKTHTKSKGIPKSEQGQNLSNAEFGESKADSQSRAFTESKVEILKSVELKEVLKNEPIQNLTPQKPKQIKNPKSRLSKPHAECPLLLSQKHQNQGLGDEKNETMRGIVRFCGPCEFCVCF